MMENHCVLATVGLRVTLGREWPDGFLLQRAKPFAVSVRKSELLARARLAPRNTRCQVDRIIGCDS